MSHRLNQQSLAMQSLAPVGSPTRPPPLVLNCARQLTSFMDSQLQRQFASYASLFTWCRVHSPMQSGILKR
jgi:hypothetical protein